MKQAIPYVASEDVFFVKMPAHLARVGDILRTQWGIREAMIIKKAEGDVYFTFRDLRYVTGEHDRVEVLVV